MRKYLMCEVRILEWGDLATGRLSDWAILKLRITNYEGRRTGDNQLTTKKAANAERNILGLRNMECLKELFDLRFRNFGMRSLEKGRLSDWAKGDEATGRFWNYELRITRDGWQSIPKRSGL